MRHYPKRTKAIGGYFELQLPKGEVYYPSLIKLNTARNALEYILRVNNYSSIYIPYFTCEVVLEPIKKLGIQYYFYTIDKNLDPIIDFHIAPTECFLYTNYFGIKQSTINKLSKEIPNLIIDDSQGFFSKPLPEIDTFYSCRKFFGVADGSYLQSKIMTTSIFEKDVSYNRISHLLKSIDLNIEEGYKNFVENDITLDNNPIKRMSSLTERLLSSIDYEDCKRIRNRNFKALHHAISHKNQLEIIFADDDAPMCYPLLLDKEGIKKKLISKRIYIPTFWPNVLRWTTSKMFENYLTQHLVSLPIDHRYDDDDMNRLINYLKQII